MNRFQTTRWSVVLQARDDTAAARQAPGELCRIYRSPVCIVCRIRPNSRSVPKKTSVRSITTRDCHAAGSTDPDIDAWRRHATFG